MFTPAVTGAALTTRKRWQAAAVVMVVDPGAEAAQRPVPCHRAESQLHHGIAGLYLTHVPWYHQFTSPGPSATRNIIRIMHRRLYMQQRRIGMPSTMN